MFAQIEVLKSSDAYKTLPQSSKVGGFVTMVNEPKVLIVIRKRSIFDTCGSVNVQVLGCMSIL